jgi:hypothetical protein
MEKLKKRKYLTDSSEGYNFEDMGNKINEIVEVLNGITKLIDYADNERERDKGN